MFERLEDWPSFAPLFEDLKTHYPTCAQEAQQLHQQGLYTPWNEKYLHNGQWWVYGIFWQGKPTPTAAHSPFTLSLLEPWINCIANAGFSLMEPGCQISPHTGYTHEVIRLHVPLLCPKDQERCAIQVGHQIVHYTLGELILFDDTQRHSAWNHTQEPRIVLLIDLLRPSPAFARV